ncbi:MAG: twin-arginine translocation signal domain-containing protein [Cyclobacteriaceae bacterium]
MKENISRRNFIRLTGMTGAALSLGIYFPADGKEMET